jgi:hypothetical protein
MTNPPGYSQLFDLATLGDEDVRVVLRPSIAECAAIAEWLEASAVETLEAEITLSRQGSDLYRYEARFAADVVQACVVTLEPVHSRLEGDFHRLYAVSGPRSRHKASRPPASGIVSLSDEEEPETVETTLIDLAAPPLEELSLALDPYPRAPGVRFEPPGEPESPAERPFAVLAELKARLGGEAGGAGEATRPESGKRHGPKKPRG